MWELLKDIKEKLLEIKELNTVKIGVEQGIGAKDAPAARIVTEYSEPGTNIYYDNGSIQIVLLLDLKNNLEDVYSQSIFLEALIRDKLKKIIKFTRVDYDQDSFTVLKSSILTFTFSGIRNGRQECDL